MRYAMDGQASPFQVKRPVRGRMQGVVGAEG